MAKRRAKKDFMFKKILIANRGEIALRVMKTAKIIISIFIVALATSTSAQWNQLKDRLFSSRYDHTVIAYTEVRDDAMVRERVVSGTNYNYTGAVELIYEKEVDMESWMTEAFDSRLDSELQLEEWMRESFQPDEKALMMEPWMTTASTLDRTITSGATCHRIEPSPRTVGRNDTRTPYSLYCIVIVPPPPAPLCGTGIGNSPPARKLACSPFNATSVGLARTLKY